jgi:short-subunit dehydrogenase
MNDWLQDVLRDRPWWMNAVMVFCGYMTFVYMPWDIFVKPVVGDQEVWFGFMFTGWGAKWAALPHWFVYAAGLYGFRRRRPWMAVAAPLYLAQVAIGMLIWPILQYGSLLGVILGLIAAVPFALITMAFWNARDHFLANPVPLRERYGDWALVTGASAGLGAEFARALAREGVSCVLTARSADRLDALGDELERQHGIQTRRVSVDLAAADGPEELARAVADLPLGILVNNAGFGYAGRFDGQDVGRLREMIALNCVAPVALTHLLVPAMKERGRGAVIVTGSVSGRQPLALHAVYSASKAFDLLFGEALYVELRGEGIDVLVIEPGATETEFQSVSGQLAHAGESAESVVRTALRALGQQPSVISGWFNYLRANFAGRLASRPMAAYIAKDVMSAQTPEESH